LGLPSILIPLSLKGSRGDQIKNAEILEEKGGALVLKEEALTPAILADEIEKLLADKKRLKELGQKAKDCFISNGTDKIIKVLDSVNKK